MAASVQFRPRNRDLGVVMREVDENLAAFLGIQNVEMETNDHFLVQESDQFDEDLKCAEPQPVTLTFNASQAEPCLVAADDNFLNLDMEKSDHDWLLKQPDSSLLPSLDADLQDSDTTSKSELERETSSPLAPLPSAECCNSLSKRPSSSEERKPVCRAVTPTGRPSLSAKSKPSRASTPTSRPTLLPSSKPRSSTPTSKTSIPNVSKSRPRSATPTHKPASPSTTPTVPSSDRSSKKTASIVTKSSGPSRGASPTVKTRPSKPSDMPKRAASASRGRVSSHSSSSSKEKARQKSCSPPKLRAPISTGPKPGSKMVSRSRGYSNVEDDDVNPVVMGTKMVDRVVNMRKLAPPKQVEYASEENSFKSSQGNSGGFGRSLSKKSLEMAIRHMDIRRSVPDRQRTSGVGSAIGKVSSGGGPESPQTSNSESSKSSSSRSSSSSSSSSRSYYFLNGAGMDD